MNHIRCMMNEFIPFRADSCLTCPDSDGLPSRSPSESGALHPEASHPSRPGVSQHLARVAVELEVEMTVGRGGSIPLRSLGSRLM